MKPIEYTEARCLAGALIVLYARKALEHSDLSRPPNHRYAAIADWHHEMVRKGYEMMGPLSKHNHPAEGYRDIIEMLAKFDFVEEVMKS